MTGSNAFSLFDESWYLGRNPDVASAVAAGQITARDHFEFHGKAEGRSPHPLFSAQQYLFENSDVFEAVVSGHTTAYDHFVSAGDTRRSLSAIGLRSGVLLGLTTLTWLWLYKQIK